MKRLAFAAIAIAGCSGRQPMDVTTGDPPEITLVGQNPDATAVVNDYARETSEQVRLTFLVHPRRTRFVAAAVHVRCLEEGHRSPETTIHHDPGAGTITLELEGVDCAPADVTVVIQTSRRAPPIRMTIPRAVLYRAQRWPEVR